MLVIPNLCETLFHRIEAVLSVPIEDLTEDEQENNCETFGGAFLGRIQGERDVFVSLELNNVEAKYACLSLSFEKPPEWPQFWQRVCAELDDPELEEFPIRKWQDSDPELIWKELAFFLSRNVDLIVEGAFAIDRDKLPLDSLIASMIGLRTLAGEEQFLLSGAQFAVRGFPDDTISWYLKPGSHGRKV